MANEVRVYCENGRISLVSNNGSDIQVLHCSKPGESLISFITEDSPEEHPYIKATKFSGMTIPDNTKINALKNRYLEAIEFCLDSEALADYKRDERILSFEFNDMLLSSNRKLSGFSVCTATMDGELELESGWESPNVMEIGGLLSAVENGEKSIRVVEYFSAESLEDIVWIEFGHMLRSNVRVQRCKLCKKLFLISDNRHRDFCSRVYTESGRSCQKAGPKLVFQQKLSGNEALNQYTHLYNRIYSRYLRSISKGDAAYVEKIKRAFVKWSQDAQGLRQKYVNNEVDAETFILLLDDLGDPVMCDVKCEM